MSASNALAPSAQRTTQRTQPATCEQDPCGAEPIARARRRARPPARAPRPAGSARLRRRAHQPRADDHAVGARVGRRGRRLAAWRCRSRARPGTSVCAACAASTPAGRRRAPLALARRAGAPRPCRGSRARGAPIAARRSSRGGRRDERHERDARRASQAARTSPRLLERQVGHDQAARPRARRARRRSAPPRARDEVRVAHDHDRDGSASARADLEHAVQRGARRAAPACRRRG